MPAQSFEPHCLLPNIHSILTFLPPLRVLHCCRKNKCFLFLILPISFERTQMLLSVASTKTCNFLRLQNTC